VAGVLILLVSVQVFCGQSNPAKVNNATGELKVTTNGREYIQLKFQVFEKKPSPEIKNYCQFWKDDISNKTYAEVKYNNIDGCYAWFAGRCVKGDKNLLGKWFFAVVHDGGKPGYMVDHIWLEWLPDTPNAEKAAESNVKNLKKPAQNVPIQEGDIVVYFSEKK